MPVATITSAQALKSFHYPIEGYQHFVHETSDPTRFAVGYRNGEKAATATFDYGQPVSFDVHRLATPELREWLGERECPFLGDRPSCCDGTSLGAWSFAQSGWTWQSLALELQGWLG